MVQICQIQDGESKREKENFKNGSNVFGNR